jgi:hypothetical protein
MNDVPPSPPSGLCSPDALFEHADASTASTASIASTASAIASPLFASPPPMPLSSDTA